MVVSSAANSSTFTVTMPSDQEIRLTMSATTWSAGVVQVVMAA